MKRTAFEKLPAVEGSVACLTCGAGARSDLEMDRIIAVGFGTAGYSRDGEGVWSEAELDPDTPDHKWPTVATVEALAEKDPDSDWRIYFYAPLYETEYQRQGPKQWVLVRKGDGFA